MEYQKGYIRDISHLVIVEKGRQIGLSYAASYKAVRLAAPEDAKLDVWVMSRDEIQAKQFLLYCKRWARVLKFAAEDLGEVVVDNDKDITAHVLKFANGLCIYCLSSNPDAIVGKTGHVILDEFALHKDQRQLYAVAKPVTQWGGTLTLISTHRGAQTVFAEIIRDIKERGNKMGWSLHTIPIQKAVEQGIVERINKATKKDETRAAWLARQRAECLDEEQWLQEYSCIPSDESSAFITYEMIAGCEDGSAPRDFAYLQKCTNPIYIGFDVARTTDLSVIDVEEKVGDVFWERVRIEMRGKKFAEQEFEVDTELMRLPQVNALRAVLTQPALGCSSLNAWSLFTVRAWRPSASLARSKRNWRSRFALRMRTARSAMPRTKNSAPICAVSKRKPPPAAIFGSPVKPLIPIATVFGPKRWPSTPVKGSAA